MCVDLLLRICVSKAGHQIKPVNMFIYAAALVTLVYAYSGVVEDLQNEIYRIQNSIQEECNK